MSKPSEFDQLRAAVLIRATNPDGPRDADVDWVARKILRGQFVNRATMQAVLGLPVTDEPIVEVVA